MGKIYDDLVDIEERLRNMPVENQFRAIEWFEERPDYQWSAVHRLQERFRKVAYADFWEEGERKHFSKIKNESEPEIIDSLIDLYLTRLKSKAKKHSINTKQLYGDGNAYKETPGTNSFVECLFSLLYLETICQGNNLDNFKVKSEGSEWLSLILSEKEKLFTIGHYFSEREKQEIKLFVDEKKARELAMSQNATPEKNSFLEDINWGVIGWILLGGLVLTAFISDTLRWPIFGFFIAFFLVGIVVALTVSSMAGSDGPGPASILTTLVISFVVAAFVAISLYDFQPSSSETAPTRAIDRMPDFKREWNKRTGGAQRIN